MFGVLLKVHQADADGPTKIAIGVRIPFGYKVRRYSEFRYDERFGLVVGSTVRFSYDDDGEYPRLITMESAEFDSCFICESYIERQDAVSTCGECTELTPKEKVDEVIPLKSATLKTYRYSKGLTLSWGNSAGLRIVTLFESHPWYTDAMSFEIGLVYRVQGWCDREFPDGNKYITLIESPEQI
jgi:hypothetical protein